MAGEDSMIKYSDGANKLGAERRWSQSGRIPLV
jgi:hypothetical protein